jgi:diaminopropionate ammonia-lyase
LDITAQENEVEVLFNPYRGSGLPQHPDLAEGRVVRDPSDAIALFKRCPVAAASPLLEMPQLASALGVDTLHLKDERQRMGLGSFKALGATHAIAREAMRCSNAPDTTASCEAMANALDGTVYACASAGNHGLSVATGATHFGARAMIYLATTVPEAFADRLRERGATVVRAGDDYEASMSAAAADAETNGWTLLSDSSWPGYVEPPSRVMEGYLIMGAEVTEAMLAPPSHVFLQAGVGGLAAAMTALFRDVWGDTPTIVIVEPIAAPALLESIRAGRPVTTSAPASMMGRLDCKEPSHLALAELAAGADFFVAVEDEQCAETVELLARHGIGTTPSGAAGVAGLHHATTVSSQIGLCRDSSVLAFITEGPELGS